MACIVTPLAMRQMMGRYQEDLMGESAVNCPESYRSRIR